MTTTVRPEIIHRMSSDIFKACSNAVYSVIGDDATPEERCTACVQAFGMLMATAFLKLREQDIPIVETVYVYMMEAQKAMEALQQEASSEKAGKP